MSIFRVAVLGATAAMFLACNKPDSSNGSSATAGTTGDAHLDPCTLLSANEAEVYVGVLVAPPYRATNDGVPDASGETCMYRESDGRQVTVARMKGGAEAGQATTAVGPWDHATWIPGGSLIVTKGDVAVHVDVSAASGKEDDAVAIAKQIVPRLDHPLDYDGAKAVASAPKPKAHPAQACDLLPKSAVEAAIGPLDGEPIPGADATECDYKVGSAQGPRSYKVEYLWQGGRKKYNMLEHGTATMAFQTDTTLKGPWDMATLLRGTQLLAVKSDVMVEMELQTADPEKAKSLMTAICSRL